jgi:predicted adenine nucleotide alpha hydrolase (AANH) superfamily ATPase
MKKFVVLILVLSLGVSVNFSQTSEGIITADNQSGVYLTTEDFEKGNLTFSLCTDQKDHEFKIGFLGSIYGHLGGKIKLKKGESKRTYNYNSIVGFKYNGDDYRVQKWVLGSYTVKGVFKVLENEGLVIYSQEDPDIHNFTRYFYSQGIDGEIKILGLRNLKKDFSDNESFLQEVKKYRRELVKKNDNGELILSAIWNRYMIG